MQRIRRKPTKNQPHVGRSARPVAQQAMPLDDGTVTTPVTLAMIQALIPLGLRTVEDALTFAKSRMRESRPYGSARAKPNGLATRPHSLSKAGIKIKVAEAFLEETPVLGTIAAYRGLTRPDGGWCSNDAEDWIRILNRGSDYHFLGP